MNNTKHLFLAKQSVNGTKINVNTEIQIYDDYVKITKINKVTIHVSMKPIFIINIGPKHRAHSQE